MLIDTAVIAVIVTILLIIITVAFGYGILTQRVKQNRELIEAIRCEFKTYQINNRSDHTMIFNKLDKILENGKH